MQAIFHGVRGSVPVSGQEFASFGGHTTCLEIRTKDVQIIIDAGSGFQNVGIAEDGLVIIAFSHFHHDHIQGFAFNKDLLTGKRDILVTSGLCNPSALQKNIQTYFDGAFFPIDLVGQMTRLRFIEFAELRKILRGVMEARTMPLRHPGGSAAFSFGTSQAKICTLFDNEFDPSQDAEFLEFINDAKLIVWDGMFCDQEMPMRLGWGHSSIEEGVAFFQRARSVSQDMRMAITHHAPYRTDEQLRAFEEDLLMPGVFLVRQNQQLNL